LDFDRVCGDFVIGSDEAEAAATVAAIDSAEWSRDCARSTPAEAEDDEAAEAAASVRLLRVRRTGA